MLTLRTFGVLDLVGPEGREISPILSQSKRMALLVYLSVERSGEFHRRDTLLNMFWPESDDVRARNALSQSLSYLRRNLPEGVIVTRGAEEVAISPGSMRIDVLEFTAAVAESRWDEALALYQGEFLQGFHVGKARGFEEWMEQERERSREVAAGAAWSLAGEQIRCGALVDGERTAQRAMDLVCTDESPVRGFIEALAEAGDRTAALNFYERFTARLREKLELEPSPGMAELAGRIRNGEVGCPPQIRPSMTNVDTTISPEPGLVETPTALIGARQGKFRAWTVAVLIAVLGAVALYASRPRDPGPEFISDLIVVPPFENRTGNRELDEVAIMAAVWVQEAVDHVEGVRTVPSTFARGYAAEATIVGSLHPALAVAERLNAGWVVGGVMRELGDSLEFRVEIIDVPINRRVQDVVEVGSRDSLEYVINRLARRVSGAVAYEFDPYMQEVEGGAQPLPWPPTIEAFREHRLGYEAYDRQEFAASFDHHMTAFDLDTTLVRAMVAAAYMTSDSHQRDSLARYANQRRLLLSNQGQLDLDILLAKIENDLEEQLRLIRAQALLDREGFYSVLQALFEMNLNQPREALEATEWYDPNPAWRRGEAHAYWDYRARAMHMLGEFEEELDEARHGRDRYPGRLNLLIAEVRASAALGRVEDVTDLLHQARALSDPFYTAPLAAGKELRAHGYVDESRDVFDGAAGGLTADLPPEELASTYLFPLAEALYGGERWAEAHEVSLSLLEKLPENLSALGMVGLTGARLGDSVLASGVKDRLSEKSRPEKLGERLYLMASISAVLGKPEEAMNLLIWAFSEGLPHGLRLHQDMNFESLRDREDFRALVAPKG